MKLGKTIAGTKGQERSDLLPMWGTGMVPGAAVAGEFVGHDEYTTSDKDASGAKVPGTERQVRYVKLRNAIEFIPTHAGAEEGRSVQHLALGVPINADTKVKLDPATLTPGMLLLVQFTEVDARYNNMRRFRVELLTRSQYADIMAASNADLAAAAGE